MLRSFALLAIWVVSAASAMAADHLIPWSEFTPAEKRLPPSWKLASGKLFDIREEGGVVVVRATAQEGALVIATHEFPLPAGTRRLTLTGRIRSEALVEGPAPSNVGRVALQLFAGSHRVDDQVHTVSGTSDWKPFRITVPVAAGVDKVQVHFGSLKAKSGTVDVSDLDLTAGP